MVNPAKVEEVNKLKELISNAKVVAIANIKGIPTDALQQIRKEARKIANLRVSKKRLMARALKEKGLEKLAERLMEEKDITPMLVTTNENIFKLAKLFMEKKVNVPAKPGMIAPKDIVIPAGPTTLPPGPALTELKALGVKTKITGGKIEITEDKVVVKEGEVISPRVANVLAMLGIKPIEVSIKLLGAVEGGIYYDEETLSTPLDKYVEDLKNAFLEAKALALEIGFPAKEVIEDLLVKAEREARALGIEAAIPEKDLIEDILISAERKALALYDEIKDKLNTAQ